MEAFTIVSRLLLLVFTPLLYCPQAGMKASNTFCYTSLYPNLFYSLRCQCL